MEAKDIQREGILAAIISERDGIILDQAQQISRLNGLLQASQQENEAWKKQAAAAAPMEPATEPHSP